jgi:hypothetical protein
MEMLIIVVMEDRSMANWNPMHAAEQPRPLVMLWMAAVGAHAALHVDRSKLCKARLMIIGIGRKMRNPIFIT